MATKTKECEVTKITISIGGKEQTVTIEQAKELKRSLDELFGKTIIERVDKWVWPYGEPFRRPWITYSATKKTALIAIQ